MHIKELVHGNFVRIKPKSTQVLAYKQHGTSKMFDLVSEDPAKKQIRWYLGYVEGAILENNPENGYLIITVSRQQTWPINKATISYSHIEIIQLGTIVEEIISVPRHLKGTTLPPRVKYVHVKM